MSNYTLENSDSGLNIDLETRNKWLISVIAILFVTLFAPTLFWLWDRWTIDIWYNGHGILITLVVIYLAREELLKLKNLPRSSNSLGFAVLIPALFLHMLDTGIYSQLLSAFAFFLSLPGFSLLLLGTKRTKNIVFLLFMMFLTLPIPLFFTESIHLGLRYIATDSVAWILPFLGVPVFSTGTLLQIPNGSLMVADACSGFSILYATIAVAIMTAYFCTNNRRRILILIVAVPLAIGVNIVRVLMLTMLVHWISLDVLETAAHEISGLLTFAIALPTIFWMGRTPQKAGK